MKYDYDLAIIGGGAAGLTATGMGVNLGAKTLMVEAERLGGDCTWHGCIPSKTLLHVSKTAHTIDEAKKFGYRLSEQMDFTAVMEHVRDTIQEVYEEADDPEIYREMGAEVEFGRAVLTDAHTLSIKGKGGSREVTARYIIIATGSKPMTPPIKGLDSVPYLTNETIFEINEQPENLAVIGAGPVGIELAQAFQRLGTNVTVLDMQPRILSHDDEELADRLLERLHSEGINFGLSVSIDMISIDGDDNIHIDGKRNGQTKVWTNDTLLIAAGRMANYKTVGLDAAGVEYTEKGITVDDRCRTNIKHIYAVGDVTGRYQFTHMSEHMSKVAVTNALLKYPMKMDEKHVPWCTYTDPELAHVGSTEKSLEQDEISYEVYRFPYNKIDRAVTDGATDGMIKIFAKKINGKILGATVYGKQAGDLIGEYALAMRNGVTLRNISDTIHPYPTYGLGVRRAADQWYVKNQSEWMTKAIKWIFGYRGNIPDLSDKDRIV